MKIHQVSSNKLKTVIIVGPGSSAEYAALSNHDIYKPENSGLIIGNGEDQISFEDIRSKLAGSIDFSTRIDVVLHSRSTSDLALQVSDGESATSNARNFLTMLDSCSDTPLNVELRCCFGGRAKNYLKEGSILVTHSSENEFLYGDLGTYSLEKILDKRLIALKSTERAQSNIEHPIFKVMDDIEFYAINPIKISLSDSKEITYAFRHPGNILLNSEDIKRYLQNQVDNCYDTFSEKIGRESVPIIRDISSEERLDYIYGSIANETESYKIVEVLQRTAETYPDIFIKLLTKKIGSHDLITHFVDTSQVEVIKSIIDTLTSKENLVNDPQSMSLLSHLSENIISMKKKEKELEHIFGDEEVEKIIENNEVIFEYLASKLKNTKIFFGSGKNETLLTHCIKQNDTKFIAILLKTKSFLNQINSKGDNAMDVALQQISRIRQDSTLSKAKKQKMENEYTVLIKKLARSGIDITEKNISNLLNVSNDNDLIVSVISNCENEKIINAIQNKLNKENESIDLPVGEEVKRSLMQIKMTLQQNFRSISGFRDFFCRAIVAAVDVDHVLLQEIIDLIPEKNMPEIMIKVIEVEPSIEKRHKLSSIIFDHLNDRPRITKENMTNIMKGLLQSDVLHNASDSVKESFVKLIPKEKRERLESYTRMDAGTKTIRQRSL